MVAAGGDLVVAGLVLFAIASARCAGAVRWYLEAAVCLAAGAAVDALIAVSVAPFLGPDRAAVAAALPVGCIGLTVGAIVRRSRGS